MKLRSGQVALYLVLVIVAITVLILMNANVFFAIRAKNHATSAGDAGVLRAAAVQAELLNEIGRENVARLRDAVDNIPPEYDYEGGRNCDDRIRTLCFLGPLRALKDSQQAARTAVAGMQDNAIESFETASMQGILKQHVFDIRSFYVTNPEVYPEPWEGAWETYAQELELALSDTIVIGPENCEYADAYEEYPLLDQGFYRAICGKMWCWFHFNGDWIFECDSHGMPKPTRVQDQSCDNSEIYSLHLKVRHLPEHLDDEWIEIIMRLTGRSRSAVENSYVLTNGTHTFAFYDYRWDEWSTYPRICFNPSEFPICGPVQAKYDVLGCAAVGRTIRSVPSCLQDDTAEGEYEWTAAAKPFGSEVNLDGEADKVTCLKRLVTPAFTDVRLVPVDAVGGRDLHTADAEWMTHVRDHIPEYLLSGVGSLGSCWYCQQLKSWESAGFRQVGREWLNNHSDDCRRSVSGDTDYRGGTAHAH